MTNVICWIKETEKNPSWSSGSFYRRRILTAAYNSQTTQKSMKIWLVGVVLGDSQMQWGPYI